MMTLQRIVLALALLFCFLFAQGSWAKTATSPVISTTITWELFIHDPERLEALIAELKDSRINTLSIVIAWRGVEAQKGQFDFTGFVPSMDRLIEAGFRLLLILDSSARELIDPRLGGIKAPAVPDWLIDEYSSSFAIDSAGISGHNLDYFDKRHVRFLQRFYQRALAFFASRYGEHIVAIAPGIAHELEIKYPQYFYRWQSYSAAAQEGFNIWLSEQGKQPAALPVINYANNLINSLPKEELLLHDFMRYRDDILQRYVCRATRWIRAHGLRAAGYFGQPLTSHDGIYGIGIIEQVVDCFDEIIIDYNFSDGWQVERKALILPMIVNYAYHLGYKQVMAGFYFERFPKDEDFQPLVNETLAAFKQEVPLLGVELGNLSIDKIKSLGQLTDQLNDQAAANPASFKLGLVASKWTFALWIGEHSNERNIIQDALLESYRLLRQDPALSVSVLGEKALFEQDLSQYDALIMAHQTSLSKRALAALKTYHQQGGRLVQDLRFDSFSLNGKPHQQWQNDLFGIAAISWCEKNMRFIYQGQTITLPHQDKQYFDCATMVPQAEYELLMRSANEAEAGLLIRGPRTLVFGFLPQLLIDDEQQAFWPSLYVDAIKDLLNAQ